MTLGRLPDTMRSAVLAEPGDAAAIRIEGVPRPVLRATDHVLIEVSAAGVSLVDLLMMRGGYEGYADFPRRIGLEFAGRVVATGTSVQRVSVGDHVCGMVFGDQGALSEYLLLADSELGLVPHGLTSDEAATLPSAAMTAYAALHLHARVQRGERVLILSAGSGVGIAVAQMAAAAGAVVHAAAGAGKQNSLLEIGADRAFATSMEDWHEALGTYDVVIDPVGGAGLARSYEVLRPGGRLVCLDASSQHPPGASGAWAESPVLFDPVRLVWEAKAVMGVNITALWKRDGSQAPLLEAALACWREGGCRPRVAGVYGLDAVADAFARIADRSTFGRVVVRLRDDGHRPASPRSNR